MAYTIVILPKALAQLGELPKKQQRQIQVKIDRLADQPFPPTCKKLQGLDTDSYRIDSGDYRVLYTVTEQVLTVTVVKIGNRKDIYRNLR